ncbi:MAG: helix-turn-helix domain-containing protein [Oligoflexales bacterium]|nr:helix-turn-helix domain-containing protein [Oligoflexales bacterium]
MPSKLIKMTHPYHYTECGLKNIWLEGVYLDKEGDLVIPHLINLHEEIAKGLALQKKRLSGGEIRFLRTHIGLSGTDLARKVVKVSPETVSRWENNKQTMDASTELLLRMLVLKKIRFDDYDFYDLADFKTEKSSRFEAKFSQKSKKWNLAA